MGVLQAVLFFRRWKPSRNSQKASISRTEDARAHNGAHEAAEGSREKHFKLPKTRNPNSEANLENHKPNLSAPHQGA